MCCFESRRLTIIPMEECVPSTLGEVLGGAVVEPGIELVDHVAVPAGVARRKPRSDETSRRGEPHSHPE